MYRSPAKMLTARPGLRFLKGVHFRKSLTESERSDGFEPGIFLKIIEHVSYLIRYCKMLLPIYIQGAVPFQMPGVFFYSPGITANDHLVHMKDEKS